MRTSFGGDGEGKCGSALFKNLPSLDGACEENPRTTCAIAKREWLTRSIATPTALTSQRGTLFGHSIRFAPHSTTRRRLSIRTRSH